MKNKDNLQNKMIVFVISLILTGLILLSFFLDDSMQWNTYKIYSCIVVNLWIFFVVPALRNSYLLNKDKSLYENWLKRRVNKQSTG